MALRALALWAAGLANLGRAKAATPPLDCKIRGLAFEYANHVQELDAAHATDVWDALELSAACGRQPPHWQEPPPRRDGPQQAATETAIATGAYWNTPCLPPSTELACKVAVFQARLCKQHAWTKEW